MDENLKHYRDDLVKAEQRSLQDYDKTLLSLSGGALGISFAFITEIIGDDPIHTSWLLMTAWGIWGISILCTLSSFYVSHLALRTAITQVDNDNIYAQTPGGIFATLTKLLNAASGLLFLAGFVFMLAFVSNNMETV